jgi:hypothetical protein
MSKLWAKAKKSSKQPFGPSILMLGETQTNKLARSQTMQVCSNSFFLFVNIIMSMSTALVPYAQP